MNPSFDWEIDGDLIERLKTSEKQTDFISDDLKSVIDVFLDFCKKNRRSFKNKELRIYGVQCDKGEL